MAKKFDTFRNPPTLEQVEEYELLYPLLRALLLEVKGLSQKKQDGVLNPLKIKMINKVLLRIKNLVQREATHEFVELLDEVSLPTNSDALFMLVQFESALDQFKAKYYGEKKDNYSWEIQGN